MVVNCDHNQRIHRLHKLLSCRTGYQFPKPLGPLEQYVQTLISIVQLSAAAIFPMLSVNEQRERKMKLIDLLKEVSTHTVLEDDEKYYDLLEEMSRLCPL